MEKKMLERDEMIRILRDYGYERDYCVNLDEMETEDIESELTTMEMEEGFYVEARRELITTKEQVLELLDKQLEEMNNPKEYFWEDVTTEYVESVLCNMMKFREKIRKAVIPSPLPDLWGYTMEFTEKKYKLILGRFDVHCLASEEDDSFSEISMGFLGNYTLVLLDTQTFMESEDSIDSDEVCEENVLLLINSLYGGRRIDDDFLRRFFRG